MADRPDDEDRAAILARRRRFVAVALSGLAVTACADGPPPCLSPPYDPEAHEGHEGPGEGAPQPCLEFAAEPEPAGPGAEPDAGAEPEPEPRPCLDFAQ